MVRNNKEYEPQEGYKLFLKEFEVENPSGDDTPRYKMSHNKAVSYANLRTYRCLDKCPAGQGVQSTTTPDEKDEYGDYKCKECPLNEYSLSHEKECSPCNSELCPEGTVIIKCDPKTGSVVCGPDIGRGELPP